MKITDSSTTLAIVGATVTCTSGCNNSPAGVDDDEQFWLVCLRQQHDQTQLRGERSETLVLTVSKAGYTSGPSRSATSTTAAP